MKKTYFIVISFLWYSQDRYMSVEIPSIIGWDNMDRNTTPTVLDRDHWLLFNYDKDASLLSVKLEGIGLFV